MKLLQHSLDLFCNNGFGLKEMGVLDEFSFGRGEMDWLHQRKWLLRIGVGMENKDLDEGCQGIKKGAKVAPM
jgi:hypothetical protein